MAVHAHTPNNQELFPPGHNRRLTTYVAALWDRRAYLLTVPRVELEAKNSNTALGSLWHLINPILSTVIYYLIFGLVLDISRGLDNYVGFLTVGVFTYQYTLRSTTGGSSSILTNLGLIRSLQFPRALLPLTAVVKNLLIHVPALGVVGVTVVATGEPFSWEWLLLPFAVILQTFFNAGMALVFARASHSVPDIHNVLPFIFRLLFYGSGVLFSIEGRFGEEWKFLFDYNPLYGILELNRVIWLDNYSMDLVALIVAVAWSLLLPIVGLIWFHKDEHFYGSRH